MIDIIKFYVRFKKCPFCKHYIPRISKKYCYWCGQKIGEVKKMSIQVNEFRYIPNENDAEYIKLLKENLERQTEITAKAVAKIKELSKSQWHWIPCSERLPENGRQVLVYARSVHYVLAKYDEMREADGTYKKQWVTFDAWKPYYTIKEVIAWMPLPEMPLPEPWKGEEND